MMAVFRIFLPVLRDGFMASVTWRPRLIQIRLPCAKRLGDVLRFFVVEKARKVLALNLFSETFCELIWCYRKRFPHQKWRPCQDITLRDWRLKELREHCKKPLKH